MTTLSADLRRRLERTVMQARSVAETGARAALEALAVAEPQPYVHMDTAQRDLRLRLRAHARQLGDRLGAAAGARSIDHVVYECAYEHWHGMLFARFLAENHLLIEPELGIAVTLAECAELAQEEEDADRWTLAARFAQRMLPQVFRPEHPACAVRLAREHRLALERLVESLPAEVFAADDSLGWVYQFWQSGRKAEVNRSEVKIGADELAAVTQLFTEPYMVSFLLDNSLGAWWAARRLPDLNEAALTGAGTEAELRRAAALTGVPLDYLRFVRHEGEGTGAARWRPAAGAFDGWPEQLGELKVLDPCCGSGHFLVAALAMLVPMRMESEGLTPRAAVDAALRDNLHGLELDPRCVELAAFALALAAWRWPDAGGYRPLPTLNVACSGLAPNAVKEEWTALAEQAAAGDTALSEQLRGSLDALHDLFRQAPLLGSLIDPRTLKRELFQGDYESVQALFAAAAASERATFEQTERAVAAQGMTRAAELLAGRYHLVITNVPYLARGKQDARLRSFCERHYDAAKKDLATVFLERCLELCAEGGAVSLVLPQNWLFLSSYRKLRTKLLKTATWRLLARLGPGAFETISGEVVKAILLTLRRGEAPDSGIMYGHDVSDSSLPSKRVRLREEALSGIAQRLQLQNPDTRVTLAEVTGELLERYTNSYQGMITGDKPAKKRCFWEQPITRRWLWLQGTVATPCSYGGMQVVVDWDKRGADMARLQGTGAWSNPGAVVSQMGSLPVSIYQGKPFDSNVSALTVKERSHLAAVWCYCSSPEYHAAVRRIDQKLNVTNATLIKVPFDLDRWTEVAAEQYPNGLPLPYTDDPTQWIFHGHPCGSVIWDDTTKRTVDGPFREDAGVLQVAVARLLGYRWPAERDDAMELAAEQRAWVRRCAALHHFADQDGIVCLPAVRGELPAADRLLRLLAAAFGEAWSDATLPRLLAAAGSPSLDDWLRNRFFEQHCKRFHHRPFIWHVWDGRRDGFHALVNYHKLAAEGRKGRQLLESLTYSYLGDWITRRKDGVERGAPGAEERLAAAFALQRRLAAILDGEPPFDLFIRWKPLAEQPIGWYPDVNDGVRLNLRPFMAGDLAGGKKGAGILRAKPNVHWRKDRGKEPRTLAAGGKPLPRLQDDRDLDHDRELRPKEDYPWFWHGDQFTGDRVNDQSLTNGQKHMARLQYAGRITER